MLSSLAVYIIADENAGPFISLIRSFQWTNSNFNFMVHIWLANGAVSLKFIYRINPLCEYSQMWQNQRMNRRQHFLYSIFFSVLLLSPASYILFKIVYARECCAKCEISQRAYAALVVRIGSARDTDFTAI